MLEFNEEVSKLMAELMRKYNDRNHDDVSTMRAGTTDDMAGGNLSTHPMHHPGHGIMADHGHNGSVVPESVE